MSEFVSLSADDQHLQSYLRGTFSKDRLALPVASLNVPSTALSEFTFRIVDPAALRRPTSWRVWLTAIRWPLLTLTFSPLLAVTVFLLSYGHSINWGYALGAFSGALFLQVSAHLFNDYYDHMKGFDRYLVNDEARVIQRGWLRACHVQQGAWLTLVAGVLMGLPAVLGHPPLLLSIGAVGLLGALEFSSNRLGLKYRGLGEIAVFFLCGPLLCLGYAQAAAGVLLRDIVFIGCFFGSVAAFTVFLRHWRDLYIDAQKRTPTLPSQLGFDQAQKWLSHFLWLNAMIALAWWHQSVLTSMLVTTLVLLSIALVAFGRWSVKSTSCLSSRAVLARKRSLALHLICGIVLSVAFYVEIFFSR